MAWPMAVFGMMIQKVKILNIIQPTISNWSRYFVFLGSENDIAGMNTGKKTFTKCVTYWIGTRQRTSKMSKSLGNSPDPLGFD
jgi:hypothetical protein